MKVKFIHESGHYAEIDTGKTSLAFASHELAKLALSDELLPHDLSKKSQSVEIVFETEDVDQAYAHAVNSGAVAVTPPTDMPWGQRLSRVRDCEGVLVEIASPMQQ